MGLRQVCTLVLASHAVRTAASVRMVAALTLAGSWANSVALTPA